MDPTPLDFLQAIGTLKELPRTGWLRTIKNPESVAAHSFRVAVLSMLAPENLNLDMLKCIRMALVHDLAESVIGDIPTFAGVPKEQKYAMEHNGLCYLQNLLRAYRPTLAENIGELWHEYEEGETPEARWARDMDKFDCLLQAHEYEQKTFGQKDLQEFQGLAAKIHSQEASRWVETLSQERQNHLNRRECRLPIVFILGHPLVSEEVADSISRTLSLPHISVDKIVRDRAKDPKFLHSQVVETCLRENFDLPAGLVVDLIESEITKIGAQQWTIVSGFPKNIEQLADFEKKVQCSNYAVWVECTLDADGSTPTMSRLDSAMQTWRPSATLFRETLKNSMSYYEELNMPTIELCKQTAQLIGNLITNTKTR